MGETNLEQRPTLEGGKWEAAWLPKPHSFRPVLRNETPNVKVSELMKANRQGWSLKAVAVVVSPDDLDLIRTIPISRHRCEDKRVSHYTKNGSYSVWPGYYVVMEMMKNGELGRKSSGMSSSSGPLGGVWMRIWSPTMPNKLCFFIWKACRKALAVRHNLERRLIRVVNKCDLFRADDEMEADLFFDCEFSRAFWFGTSLQINMTAMGVNKFLERWQWIVQ